MKRVAKKYLKVWVAFVNLNAEEGYTFSDLLDFEGNPKEDCIRAVAFIAIESNDLRGALEILTKGLHELHFCAEFIYEIRNVHHLIECDELSETDKEEIDWLIKSKYVFKILDKLWPYVEM